VVVERYRWRGIILEHIINMCCGIELAGLSDIEVLSLYSWSRCNGGRVLDRVGVMICIAIYRANMCFKKGSNHRIKVLQIQELVMT